MTQAAQRWRELLPAHFSTPHTQSWLQRNAWLEREAVPALRDVIHEIRWWMSHFQTSRRGKFRAYALSWSNE